MVTIVLERLEAEAPVIGVVSIGLRIKSVFQKQFEKDLDDVFSSDIASDVIYHKNSGKVISGLRGFTREESFDADPDTEGSVATDQVLLKVPTHRFKIIVNDGDWLEFEGLSYWVIVAKKRAGGYTDLLLHIR